ncbi:MAG: non-canonical purine NTP pyrophosphatase, partial [Verrucomicrobiota bacterium]|nr:non-canonical purine NTP pyrophosphatase [Verrucomicrobiota bacterium]
DANRALSHQDLACAFEGNAQLKARAAAEASGLPALADDSGLSVKALDGAPGIYSARWAGTDKNFLKAMERIQLEIGKDPNRNAKFVCASLGQTKKGATDGGGKILDAMLAVDGASGKYKEFSGNVASVYTYPLSKGGASGGHYNRNAETYMNVGEAMGKAMVELFSATKNDAR